VSVSMLSGLPKSSTKRSTTIVWLHVNPVLKGLYLLITCQPCSEGVVSSDYMSNLFWRGCIFWLDVNLVLKGLYLLITCQTCYEGVVSSDYMSTLVWSGCIFWLHVNPVLKGLHLLLFAFFKCISVLLIESSYIHIFEITPSLNDMNK
jgi:hypothetical protein